MTDAFDGGGLLQSFGDEVRMHVPRILAVLDVLRLEPTDDIAIGEALDFLRRVRGASAMMGLSSLGTLIAPAEQALRSARDGQKPLRPALIEAIDGAIQRVDQLLSMPSLDPTVLVRFERENRAAFELANRPPQSAPMETTEPSATSEDSPVPAESDVPWPGDATLLDDRASQQENESPGVLGDGRELEDALTSCPTFPLLVLDGHRAEARDARPADSSAGEPGLTLPAAETFEEDSSSLGLESPPEDSTEFAATPAKPVETGGNGPIDLAPLGNASGEAYDFVDFEALFESIRRQVTDEVTYSLRQQLRAEVREELEREERERIEAEVRADLEAQVLFASGSAAVESTPRRVSVTNLHAPPPNVPSRVVPPEMIEVFSDEASEHLAGARTALARLQANPGDRDAMNSLRRAVHTLKGAAGMLGLQRTASCAHRLEDLMDLLLASMFAFGSELEATLLDGLAALEQGIESVLASGSEAGEAYSEVLARCDRLLGSVSGEDTPVDLPETLALAVQGFSQDFSDADDLEPSATVATGEQRPGKLVVRVPLERLDLLANQLGELLITRSAVGAQITEIRLIEHELGEAAGRAARLITQLDEFGSRSASQIAQQDSSPRRETPRVQVRVHEFAADIATLRKLLTSHLAALEASLARQDTSVKEIQDLILGTRLVEFGELSPRLFATARSVALKQGKQVDLVFEGESVQIDRTVAEALADPMLHLVRNAIDHGIESPDERMVAGKSSTGTLAVRARREGGHVVIDVSDDGVGIQTDLILDTARHLGIIGDDEEGDAHRAYDVIFLPGFSSKETASDVSGRGIGLDIVRENVNRLGGTVEVVSEPGQGTTFRIRVPVTLAIARVVLVRAGEQLVAIPIESVEYVGRLQRRQLRSVAGEWRVAFAGRLFRIQTLIGVTWSAETCSDRQPFLAVRAGGDSVAIPVDEVLTQREVPIKRLGRHLRSLAGYLGATMLGDGRVVLVIDPVTYFGQARVAITELPARAVPIRRGGERGVALLVDDSVTMRRVLSAGLTRFGWQTIEAYDGLDALARLQESRPDVVVLDLEMPRMNGFELLRTIRSSRDLRDLPVLVLSSLNDERTRERLSALRTDAHLVKPCSVDEVAARIGHAMQAHEGAA